MLGHPDDRDLKTQTRKVNSQNMPLPLKAYAQNSGDWLSSHPRQP